MAVGGYGMRWRQDRSHSTHEGEKRAQKGPNSWEKGGTEGNRRAGCRSHKNPGVTPGSALISCVISGKCNAADLSLCLGARCLDPNAPSFS